MNNPTSGSLILQIYTIFSKGMTLIGDKTVPLVLMKHESAIPLGSSSKY